MKSKISYCVSVIFFALLPSTLVRAQVTDAPDGKVAGREAEIFAARDRKLAEARERRKTQREAARAPAVA